LVTGRSVPAVVAVAAEDRFQVGKRLADGLLGVGHLVAGGLAIDVAHVIALHCLTA
jgi:hypothetical protein